jgi:two-component system NarL family response regulator
MKQNRIRLLIVDDHAMIRKGLTATIEPESDMEVVGTAATGKEAVELFRATKPDVTIMDLTLTPEMSGTEAIRAIKRESPKARIIVLTASKGDEDIHRALHAGAATYLLKDSLGDDLIPIIREVHAGGGTVPPYVARKLVDRLTQPYLTEREVEVMQLIARGLRNKEIAVSLGVSELTCQGHVRSILAKLRVQDRTEAVTVAIQRGIIHLE